jgi:hypothetical protein
VTEIISLIIMNLVTPKVGAKHELLFNKPASGVKVYQRQTWNIRSHAVSACSNLVIGMWCHRPMHACTACIAAWHHRLMHAVTAWALLFQFCLGYTHRHLSIIDCLSFVVCPLLAPLVLYFFSFFFCCGHLQYSWSKQGRHYVPLSSLYFLDVYGYTFTPAHAEHRHL